MGDARSGAMPEPLYRQLQPRWCGLDPQGVTEHQRLRLIGAMIEVAGSEAGYAGANIKLLSALAGVSRRTFYDRFSTIETCFLATYEYVVGRAARHVTAAFHSEEGWEQKLRAGFNAYALEVVNEPRAARLALVEVLGAGPAALAERDRGRLVFERMIASTVRETPGGIELPPLVAKAIVGGVERITRLRLLNGGVEELPALADELLSWALSYNSPLPAEFPSAPKIASSPRRSSTRRWSAPGEDRGRILRSAAQLAASGGYAHLTRAQILEHADVDAATFDALFESTEECFLDALDLLTLEALACAAEASANAPTRVAAVRQGFAALLLRVADDRVLQRIAFIEVFAVGRAGIQRRERMLRMFVELLVGTLPDTPRPSQTISQAIAGGIFSVLHAHVTRGAGRRLAMLTDQLTYIALAPLIGANEVAESILTLESRSSAPTP